MGKGCGCTGAAIAVALGIILGIAGLGLAGYFWVDTRILAPEPMEIPKTKWTAVEEAAIALKLAPVIRAVKKNRESEHKVTLRPREINHLLDDYVLPDLGDLDLDVAFGDTVLIIRFSRRETEDRYLNGELRAVISGEDGDFEVTAHSFKTGKFDWPKPFLPRVAQWLEGVLETQTLVKDRPWRLRGIEQKKNGAKVVVEVIKQ